MYFFELHAGAEQNALPQSSLCMVAEHLKEVVLQLGRTGVHPEIWHGRGMIDRRFRPARGVLLKEGGVNSSYQTRLEKVPLGEECREVDRVAPSRAASVDVCP